ncbi:MAG TPA: VWA domain-containing protein [Rhizomicrobium sp.]|jgi:Ca-activated chloride channel family protein|nr:VWA domain-containing protein [Rhizomicrobium sp.]
MSGLAHMPWSRLGGLIPAISFQWPLMLWFLLLVPLLVVAYLYLLSRRRKTVIRYPSLALIRQAGPGSGWRRHVPPALMLLAFTVLLLAMARPSAEVSLPSRVATVMLVMDVSGSMRATDVNPSRIMAAQAAAKAYIKDQPRDVRIGIVAFASTALLVQSPTTDHAALNSAIDRFELQRGTAVGSGILVALSTLFPQEDFPINQFNSGNFGGYGRWGSYDFRDRYGGVALGEHPHGPPKKHVPVEPGSYKNAVVILLTDGQTNAGYDPVEAARMAGEYGVRVYTVGFGTTRGNIVGFGGFTMRAQLDEEALKKIADMTKARYFHATSAEDLKAVYNVLSRQLVVETREMEITAFFAFLAALAMLVAVGLSLAWHHRIA